MNEIVECRIGGAQNHTNSTVPTSTTVVEKAAKDLVARLNDIEY